MARRHSAISGQSCTYQVLPSHGRTGLGYRRCTLPGLPAALQRADRHADFGDLQYPTDIVLLTVLWRLILATSRASATWAELLLSAASRSTHETIRACRRSAVACRCSSDQLRASTSARPGRRLLVPGRDRREGRRALGCYLYRPCHRARGGASSTPGSASTGTSTPARRFLRRLVERSRERKPQRDVTSGQASAVPQSDPLDPGT